MLIGVPKEIKDHEYRVGLTPESVGQLVRNGHQAIVERGAGHGIGVSDAAYQAVGADVATTAEELFSRADMIVKVKEPQAGERKLLRDGQILFAYLHLAPDHAQTRDLVDSGAICIAYETVTDADGGLPLLKPMSQVAGRLSVQAGASTLGNEHGGAGILLGGVPGVFPAKVIIIGGGVVGFNAAQMAVGLQADVTIVDRDQRTLEGLARHFGPTAKIVYSTDRMIEQLLTQADLVIGAVLVPGAAAPKLISRQMVHQMKDRSVIVDVAIDQGGCFETSRPTTHSAPTYIVDGIVHYCVANMPGCVARTSTYALNNVTLQHTVAIANKGWRQALIDDPHLLNGLNVYTGKVTCEPVAQELGYTYTPAERALSLTRAPRPTH